MFLENRKLEEELLFSLAAFLHLKKSSEPRKRRLSNLRYSATLKHEIRRRQLPGWVVLGKERCHQGRKPRAAGCERCGSG